MSEQIKHWGTRFGRGDFWHELREVRMGGLWEPPVARQRGFEFTHTVDCR